MFRIRCLIKLPCTSGYHSLIHMCIYRWYLCVKKLFGRMELLFLLGWSFNYDWRNERIGSDWSELCTLFWSMVHEIYIFKIIIIYMYYNFLFVLQLNISIISFYQGTNWGVRHGLISEYWKWATNRNVQKGIVLAFICHSGPKISRNTVRHILFQNGQFFENNCGPHRF